MKPLHKISKCLISLIVLLFFGVIVIYARSFLEKNKGTMNIIWRDFTKNGYHEPLEFQYKLKKNGKNEYITYELIPNETLSIELQGGERCAIKSSANVCYWLVEMADKIEIFLYDTTNIEKLANNVFVLNKIDGVLGYVLVMYDNEKNKMYEAISLDNRFNIEKINEDVDIVKLGGFGINNFLNYAKQNDFAFYNPLYDSNISYYQKGKNGIVVKSILTNDILLLISE